MNCNAMWEKIILYVAPLWFIRNGIIFLTCTSFDFLLSFLSRFSCPGNKFLTVLSSSLLQHCNSSLGLLYHTQNALQHLIPRNITKINRQYAFHPSRKYFPLASTVSTCRQSSTSLGILGSPKGSWELGSPSRCPEIFKFTNYFVVLKSVVTT